MAVAAAASTVVDEIGELRAKRFKVMNGEVPDARDVTIVVVPESPQRPPPPAAPGTTSCIFIWPGGRISYTLGLDEVHFVLGDYVYILHRDAELAQAAPTLPKQPKRLPKEAKGYQHPTDLLMICGDAISAEAILLGEELHMNDYKLKYAERLWFPTSQEYSAWMASIKPPVVQHVIAV